MTTKILDNKNNGKVIDELRENLEKGLDDNTQEKDKNFLIAVIGNIFKTPTDKIFKTKEAQFGLDFSNYYKNIANVFVPNANRDEIINNARD